VGSVEKKTLIIRADAGPVMGTGHVMRCFALAQAWRRMDGRALFAMAEGSPALEARLTAAGMAVERLDVRPGSAGDAERTAALAAARDAAWIAVDGYQFSAEYQQALKSAGRGLLFVDDYGHCAHYSADFVLNQNVYAEEVVYHCAPHTQCLLGPRYALLRDEFLRRGSPPRIIPAAGKNVLVTMGGADPDNVTPQVMRALQVAQVPALKATVVVGNANPRFEALQSAAREAGEMFTMVWDAGNMSELMAAADLAVTGGGSTCYEIAFMGLPALVCILAENQRPVAQAMDAAGVMRNVGWARELSIPDMARAIESLLRDPASRGGMSISGKKLVDGKGAERTLTRMNGAGLRLRPAAPPDIEFLWRLANDPEVRMRSFSTEFIPWDHHIKWFNAKTGDPNCILLIGTTADGEALGPVRFDLENRDEAIISISISRDFRGRGYAAEMIKAACEYLFAHSSVRTVRAYVKMGNVSSMRSFTRAWFRQVGDTAFKGQPCAGFVLNRPAERPAGSSMSA
jgi:UDP-2,4-diacetamido-2,4,6-trideoxy-beta-L-altropyranose hydrolase